MATVFISYAREDLERVRPLVGAIEGAGWSVFWDRKIPPGMTWRQYIGTALDNAKCVIVVWSRSSVESDWVIEEADDGRQRKILVPITIEDVKPPLGFRTFQLEDFSSWKGDPQHSGAKRLLMSIERITGEHLQTSLKKEENVEAPSDFFTNSLGMEFVLVPAGTFKMGSDEDDSEQPVHEVTIRKPFFMQTTAVTQKQWKRVMSENPSLYKDCGDDCPVEMVSWKDVKQFLVKLNINEDGEYRLPTEAEWEYAARSGGEDQTYSGGEDLDELGWYTENSGDETNPVGQLKPNGLGIYDMSGNVSEWVEDDWHDDYQGAPKDDRAWIDKARGAARVVRGGSMDFDARFCRAAARSGCAPGERLFDLGFRLSRSVTLIPP
jgi:formylglycine-generating enzyme required for sulfatase activity